jgi:hypothetical protein
MRRVSNNVFIREKMLSNVTEIEENNEVLPKCIVHTERGITTWYSLDIGITGQRYKLVVPKGTIVSSFTIN